MRVASAWVVSRNESSSLQVASCESASCELRVCEFASCVFASRELRVNELRCILQILEYNKPIKIYYLGVSCKRAELLPKIILQTRIFRCQKNACRKS